MPISQPLPGAVLDPSSPLYPDVLAVLGNDGTGEIATNYTTGSNHALLNGAPPPLWGAGPYGGSCLTFDGQQNKLVVANYPALQLGETFSMNCMIYVTDWQNSAWPYITGVLGKTTNCYQFRFGDGTMGDMGMLSIVLTDGSTWHWAACTSAMATNSWHHIGATSDGSTLRVYIDGQVAASAAGVVRPQVNTNDLWIGREYDDTCDRVLNGSLENVQIANACFSAAQEASWYANPYQMFYTVLPGKTIAWSAGNVQKIMTTSNCELTFTAPPGPAELWLIITHDSTTQTYNYTWPSSVKWPSAVPLATSNTTGAVDVVRFLYDGTRYLAQGVAGY